jgi:CheY-like chemotaxis protein
MNVVPQAVAHQSLPPRALENTGAEIGDAQMIAGDLSECGRNECELHIKLELHLLLGRLTRAIARRRDLPGIFQLVTRTLEDSLAIDFACVCLYDSTSEVLTVNCVGALSEAVGLDMGLTEHVRITNEQGGLGRCACGQLVYEADLAEVQFLFAQRLAGAGIRALVAVPLLLESTVVGVILAARRAPHSFSTVERDFLRELGEHVALLVHQIQRYDGLRQAYDDVQQTQAALTQRERLNVLGQIASGLTHDISNALSPAALYTQSLLDHDAGLSAEARNSLGVVLCSIDKVVQILARMKKCYRERGPRGAFLAVDLNGALEQVFEEAALSKIEKALRILYIDDDPVTLKWLGNALEKEGHEVIIADGGGRGVDAFRAAQLSGHYFDIVITDLTMPCIDGRKVASAVKAAWASMPVILLSGSGDRMLAEGDIPPQVDCVLGKPPKLSELRQAFTALVRNKANEHPANR